MCSLDQGSLQHKTSPVENHGLQEPRTHGPDVISTEDQQVQPPPAQDLNCKLILKYFVKKMFMFTLFIKINILG